MPAPKLPCEFESDTRAHTVSVKSEPAVKLRRHVLDQSFDDGFDRIGMRRIAHGRGAQFFVCDLALFEQDRDAAITLGRKDSIE